MGEILEVECVHLEDELMRVRFANSQLLSDHPKKWGGTDTGPSPGTMVLMALASASALAGRQFATRKKLDVAHIGTRMSSTAIQEGFAGKLSHVSLPYQTYTQRFWRLLEAEGRLSAAEKDALVAAMAENRIAKTIRNGVTLEERLIYHRSPNGRAVVAKRDTGVDRSRLAPGVRRKSSIAGDWDVSASALDDRTCCLKAAGSMSVAADKISSQRGPTPEELLLGGLASCTAIHVARYAMLQDIPVESVRVRVRAELPQNPGEPITHVEKVADVVGELADQEITKLEHFAQFCAYGVTLSRGTEIADSVLVTDAQQRSAALSPLQAFDRPAPIPSDPAFCDDKSCCIPTAGQ
jgi:uncharacterized OsmC-like protein